MIQEFTLLDWASTHARPSDPDTSHEAARSAETLASRHQRSILDVLRAIGPCIGQEVADRTDLDRHQVMRRMSELVARGLVEDSGERRKNPSGRRAVVWRLT